MPEVAPSNRERLHGERPGGHQRKRLIFVHVPRTGGTTLDRIVARNYSKRQTFAFVASDMAGSIARYRALDERRRASLRLFTGHVAFGLDQIVGPADYVTMLRDPVERAVSIFEYIARRPSHPLHAHARRMTLMEFLDSELYDHASNGQCKLLSGVELEAPPAPADAAMLELAWENLGSRFAAIGLTERYDESLLVYRHRLGWRRLSYVRENSLKGRTATTALEPEVVEELRQRNEFDVELYRRAAELFEQQLAAIAHHQRQLESMRRMNALTRPWLQLRSTVGRRRRRVRDIGPGKAVASRAPDRVSR